MKKYKSILSAGLGLAMAAMCSLSVYAATGTMSASSAATQESLNRIGLSASPEVISVTLEGNEHIYNYLVPLSGKTTITGLPEDDYAVLINNSDNFEVVEITASNAKGCVFDEYNYLTVNEEGASVDLGIKIDAVSHRGYTDSVHFVGKIS